MACSPVATTNGHGHWPWAWAQDLEALGQELNIFVGARGVSLRAADGLSTRASQTQTFLFA